MSLHNTASINIIGLKKYEQKEKEDTHIWDCLPPAFVI